MTRSLTGALAAAGTAILISVSTLQAGPVSAVTPQSKSGGEQAGIPSISCTSASTCEAVGYLLPPGENLAFVTSEANGVWRPAEKVPGLSLLAGGFRRGVLDVVSCSATGSCSAGGFYVDHSGNVQAFVVSQKGGTWSNAQEVPGTAALNVGGAAVVNQMSCRSAGNCTAAGNYEAGAGQGRQAFVVSEKNGTWGSAEEIPGLAALDSSLADVNALSCPAPGDCTVGGDYNSARGTEPFVVSQRNGAWGLLQPFPAIRAVNTDGVSSINALSCRSVGNCTASGTYRTITNHNDHAFFITERKGTWGAPRPIAGMARLPGGGEVNATIESLSCPSAGNCTIGGTYSTGGLFVLPFIATETNGRWGGARALPGVATFGAGPVADLTALVCPTVGNCTAVGDYTTNLKNFNNLAWVASEKNGKWGQAETLPGAKALSKGREFGPLALSCGAPGDCAAGGLYAIARDREAPFVATQKNGIWSNAERAPGT